MWGKIIIPMYRLWSHGLYGLYGPWCPLSPKRPINSISLFLVCYRRSTGLLQLWWWAAAVFMLLMEDQLCDWKSTVLLEDQLFYWKINHYVGSSTLLLEDQLYYWKINCVAGRSVVLLEDQLYCRQSTKIDGNYWSRIITARRWFQKYVGAEYGVSKINKINKVFIASWYNDQYTHKQISCQN